MVIITVFFLFLFDLLFKKYGCPNVTVPKFFISRVLLFSVRCNYSVTRSVNHAVVLTHCECYPRSVRGFANRITRYYSKKPSSRVKTHCDEENQAFLTMDCDRLQGPHYFLSGESMRSRRFV